MDKLIKQPKNTARPLPPYQMDDFSTTDLATVAPEGHYQAPDAPTCKRRLRLAEMRSITSMGYALKHMIQLVKNDVDAAREEFKFRPASASPAVADAFLDNVRWLVRDAVAVATWLRECKAIAERVTRRAETQLASEAGEKHERVTRRVRFAVLRFKAVLEEALTLHQETLKKLSEFCDNFTDMEVANKSKDEAKWEKRRDLLDAMMRRIREDAYV